MVREITRANAQCYGLTAFETAILLTIIVTSAAALVLAVCMDTASPALCLPTFSGGCLP